jgi:hypothetical protein
MHKNMWCATSRELASKHEPEEMTKATLALSLLLSSELILSTKAGAADTEETAFWKDWHCLNGLVLLFSVCEYSIDKGVRVQKWPNGISVVPTRCCTSRRVYCIAFSMFSPTRKSTRSCSQDFRCVRLGARSWQIPPPRCVCLEPRRHSQDRTLEFLFKPLYLVGIKFCSS